MGNTPKCRAFNIAEQPEMAPSEGSPTCGLSNLRHVILAKAGI